MQFLHARGSAPWPGRRGGTVDRNRGDGFEVPLGDLVFAVSSALDLVSPAVVGHHFRVARIARAVARQLAFPPDRMRDLLLAAALHDSGAFSLRERLDLLRFEIESPEAHAESGYRLLKAFPHFERAAEIVRFHHLPWDHRRGEQWRGSPVPRGSHLLHLADRASVLPIDWTGASGWGEALPRAILDGSGPRFVPEFVDALAAAAAQPSFWRELAASGDADLRADPAFGAVTLSEADFRGLAHLFWQIVDYRSRFTATHTSGVAAVAGFLAPLAGVTGAAGRRVAIAAGLHDLGKLAVPCEILEKEPPLSRFEQATIRDHPLHGWRILGGVPGMEEINAWANLHHERLDGSGYPFQIPASRIPLESRIVAVADVFTALTEERPYRRGMSGREAIGILQGMAGAGALDPEVVALMETNREEAATIRRLAQEGASDRYRAFLQQAPAAISHNAA
jgi:HD-GYP domain-containing protein (c-di-GMP phosphodiesterase class II)